MRTAIDDTGERDVLLSIRGLRKSFGDKQVLRDVNFDLRHGENLVVAGKSGTGKSVLIKCLVRLINPDGGSMLFKGADMAKAGQREMQSIRRHFGFLFQTGAIYDSMSVRANLEFPLRRVSSRLSPKEIDLRIHEALNDVGLVSAKNLMPSELSGGMRKRVGLARTIIMKPDIILYDEPTTGLDSITGSEIITLINQVRDKYKSSSIVITHDPDSIKTNGDRIILLHEGHVYAEGTFQSFQGTNDPFVRRILKLD